MGYRSDVGIVLGFLNADEANKFITTYKIKKPEFWENEIGKFWQMNQDSSVIYAQMDSVKWYPEHRLVMDISEMLEFAIENFQCAYHFIRIGENEDDIEIEGDTHKEDDGSVRKDLVHLTLELNDMLTISRRIILVI